MGDIRNNNNNDKTTQKYSDPDMASSSLDICDNFDFAVSSH